MYDQRDATTGLFRPALVIDGARATAAAELSVINPATGAPVGTCPDIDRAMFDLAVRAARAGADVWKATPMERRREALRLMADRIEANLDSLTAMLTAEQGKPLAAARGEIANTALTIREVADLDLPPEVLQDDETLRIERHRVPLGVVAAIAPWNFPIKLGYWKVAPALLTGNAVILKPSPFTPLTTLAIGELIHDLLPRGVFQTVAGGDAVGPWLTEHPDIDKVSFTGSSATGSRVMASASGSLKRVTLELGGNDAAIVLDDADVETVVPKVFWAAFRNSGQVCIASKRIYVHDSLFDAFRDRFVAMAKSVRVGNGVEDGIELGPIQNKLQFDKVMALVADCKRTGLAVHEGPLDPSASARGYFVPVTVVETPPEESRIVQVEPFGPIVPLLKYSSLDEVIGRVNASDYGLGGSVWTSDPGRGAEVAARIDSGIVWINDAQAINTVTPFGGMKKSGMGVESGIEGLAEYTAGKTIVLRRG
ncbi:aldehyde dehydrogenase family protein [Mesobacterium pallidum]|uniref:aldehyde dehydrogenase family protein n=1 Tax=Mesobacterium pallidum TaxID=2872037 RepID=UPI001EE2ADB0|nr:aldehyde dehydrogenase family protein [Mesobacterium pallidum]